MDEKIKKSRCGQCEALLEVEDGYVYCDHCFTSTKVVKNKENKHSEDWIGDFWDLHPPRPGKF